MDIQNTDGTSDELTVDSAADRIAGLLSEHPEDKQAREPQSKESAKSAPDDEPLGEDETEQASPDEESDETGDEPDEEAETPQTYRAKINGEEVEVTLDELLKGYSRTQDYTRKTQDLATQRKKAEAEEQAVRAERQKYSQVLTQLESIVTQSAGPEPDWEKLANENPEEFQRQWAVHQLKEKRLATIREEQTKVQEAEAASQRKAFGEYLAQQRELLQEKLPEWQKPEVAKKEKAELVAYAKDQGFSDEDLAQIVDHRALIVLRKAMLYDKAQKNRPNVQKKIETVMATKPGVPGKSTPRQVSEMTRSKQRLAKTGRVEDAAAVIEKMLGGK